MMMYPNGTQSPDDVMSSMSMEGKAMEMLMNWTHTFSMTPYTTSGDTRADRNAEVVRQVQWAVYGVFTPIFCVLGMVGNVLAVVTWTRPALKSSTGRFLSAQAVSDFGVLLTWMLTISAREWVPDMFDDVVYATFFSYVATPLYYFCVHCSVWITLAITVERYIMVCWATHSKRLCGMKQANIGVCVIVTSSIIGNIPHFFMYNVSHESAGDILSRTGLGTGSSAKLFLLYISCISLIAIPWFCVLFFNYKIVSQIALSNRRMMDKKTEEASLKAKKTEWQITRLLLAVTFTYLSVMGPYCLIQIALILHTEGVDPHLKNIAIRITKAGYVLNSSLNFILYCMMGRRFRRELKTMLGIKLSDSDMTTVYTTSSEAGSRSDTTKANVAIVKK